MNEQFIAKLKKLAEQSCWADKLNEEGAEVYVDDYAGGNIDDAYFGGYNSGEILLARDILDELKVEYKVKE